jgi:hypothetical protein
LVLGAILSGGRPATTRVGVELAASRSTIGADAHSRTYLETTMKYLCLIYDEEKKLAAMPKNDSDAFMGEYFAFSNAIRQSGHFVAGDALKSVQTATTVRVRNGKQSTTDGPFAETKEQLGGYYLIEAKDLNEAIQIAARIPSAKTGSIEVRPIMVFDKQP